MAIGVDSSKWKPRSLKGTPAAKAGYIISACVLGSGFMVGAFYQFSGLTKNLRKNIEPVYEDPIEVVERKQLISIGITPRSGDQIRKLMEEENRPDLPDK
ncbi:unnamed protein product [Danaus chrysippus]|uniref:(African queen) hypothetical protein n=1 Tax=Danaus chrysippus TaxID=151541 RepID=A0A8J2VW48_9NEOP|nr:unnamed protein product [Danaus chrysippus]